MNTLFRIATSLICLFIALTSCNKQEEIHPVRKTVKQAVFASGYVEQEDEYVVAATVDGTIRELNIREGDLVTEDQLLVRIKSDIPGTLLEEAKLVYTDAAKNARPDSPQLSQIQTQIDLAREQLADAQLNHERYSELRKTNAVSQLEYEKIQLQYKSAQSNLSALEKNYRQMEQSLRLSARRSLEQVKNQEALFNEYSIKAIGGGKVLEVRKKKGELVRKGEVIARIGSGNYRIKLFIAESDITRLRTGQQAIVQMNNYPDTTFTATVTRLYPLFDQSEQSYIVEAVFVNPPELLLSGTQLQANIRQKETRNVLVIPAAALIRGKYVQLKDGREIAIKTGQKFDGWIEVKSGVTEKDILLVQEEDAGEGIQMPGAE